MDAPMAFHKIHTDAVERSNDVFLTIGALPTRPRHAVAQHRVCQVSLACFFLLLQADAAVFCLLTIGALL
jgi:hypothetical protein